MAVLRPVEMRLVDDLFGMSSGWVLDFSDRTFEEFFRHEVGIEIYDDAYGFIGTSKGKHLSAFLQAGQPAAVVNALVALWEYRQDGLISRGEKETVNGGRERLNVVLQSLGGMPLRAIRPQHRPHRHSLNERVQASGCCCSRTSSQGCTARKTPPGARLRLRTVLEEMVRRLGTGRPRSVQADTWIPDRLAWSPGRAGGRSRANYAFVDSKHRFE